MIVIGWHLALEVAILGVIRPTESIGNLCCGVRSKRDRSILNKRDSETAAADCNAPDILLSSHYIVSHETRPMLCGLSSNFL